jgi:hypothetical protein
MPQVPTLVKKYKEPGQTTISGILAQRYGEPVRYAAAVLTIVALGIVAVALYASGGAVLAAVLHIDKTPATLLVHALRAGGRHDMGSVARQEQPPRLHRSRHEAAHSDDVFLEDVSFV